MEGCKKYSSLVLFYLNLVILVNIFVPSPVFPQKQMAALDRFRPDLRAEKAELSRQDLEAFTDNVIRTAMQQLHIPGVVVLCVKDGEVYFRKGYGYANLEHQTPVDPDRTLFRVGSITKLFTSTAIMQLAERGLLNLDDPVNDHFRLFKIDNAYPNPVTIGMLLTHTAGFDNHNIERYSEQPTALEPLGDYLKMHLPPVIAGPGETIDYSNFGTALAGFLVEEITGMPYCDYIRQNILTPLEMTRSGFTHETTNQDELAVGYRFTGKGYKTLPFEFLNLWPSGAMVSTATDMAKFMMAHLQNGRYRGRQILTPKTAEKMHSRQVGFHAKMPGWCYGFYEASYNGMRAILHSGQPRGFASLIYLLKEKNLGMFIAYNSNDTDLLTEYIELFLGRYFSDVDATEPAALATAAHEPMARFAGVYRANAPQTSIAKLQHLIENREVVVTENPDGTLNIAHPDFSFRAYELEPMLFRSVTGRESVAFQRNEAGAVTRMFLTEDKPRTLQKLVWWQTHGFQMTAYKGFEIIFLVSTVFILYLLFSRKNSSGRLSWLSLLTCGLNFVFLFSLLRLYSTSDLRFGIPVQLTSLLCLPLLSTVLFVIIAPNIFLIWKKKSSALPERLHFSLLGLTFLAFIAFLHYWNLLGFRF